MKLYYLTETALEAWAEETILRGRVTPRGPTVIYSYFQDRFSSFWVLLKLSREIREKTLT